MSTKTRIYLFLRDDKLKVTNPTNKFAIVKYYKEKELVSESFLKPYEKVNIIHGKLDFDEIKLTSGKYVIDKTSNDSIYLEDCMVQGQVIDHKHFGRFNTETNKALRKIDIINGS